MILIELSKCELVPKDNVPQTLSFSDLDQYVKGSVFPKGYYQNQILFIAAYENLKEVVLHFLVIDSVLPFSLTALIVLNDFGNVWPSLLVLFLLADVIYFIALAFWLNFKID